MAGGHETVIVFHKVDRAWVGMAWKKGEPAVLCVPLESKAATEAAKKNGVYRDIALRLANGMREVGMDVGLHLKVQYRQIAEWPGESGVSTFAFAHAICTGESLDNLKSRERVVRECTVCLEAIIRESDMY